MNGADPSTAGQIRVVVVDDQTIVREGLVTVLSLMSDISVVAEGADGPEAVRLAAEFQPDVMLIDLRMPVLDGAGAIAQILAATPALPIVVLTTFADDESIAKALLAGARGYLTKDADRHQIAGALRQAVQGQMILDPAVSAKLIAGLSATPAALVPERPGSTPAAADYSGRPGASSHAEGTSGPSAADRISATNLLTAREHDVLDAIGRGLSNQAIAAELYISTATVKTHINNLFAKIGAHDRNDAIRLLRDPDSPLRP
jgi:DNA-binding NarL/FixJ family response regulator